MQKVKQEKFEGPLDLLLNLIEKEKLDICKISLAKITDSYLKEIQKIDDSSENMADFLIVASKLLYLKSKALLPEEGSEEEEIEDLEERLKEYKKFKEASKYFQNVLNENKRSFEAKILTQNVTLFTPPKDVDMNMLMSMFQEALQRVPETKTVEKKTEKKVTLEEKVEHIKKLISKKKEISFNSVIGKSQTRGEVIVTFLAILELIKGKEIKVKQKKNFADLMIVGL